MIIICTILALIIACIIDACLYKKQDIVTAVVQGLIEFLMFYAVISSILLVFNIFTIIRSLVLVIIAELIIAAILIVVCKRTIEITSDYRNCICAVLILVLMIPFVINKNGYLGVAQDAGVYQTRAIAMINGDFDNFFTFDEYDILSEAEKAEYINDLDVTLTGYYRTQTDTTFKTDKHTNDTTGILHGIHAYSAILALVGTIFGMANMMYTGSIFMFCMLYTTYMIMRNLKIRWQFIGTGIVLLALSPAVLWLFKTTLSETFLIVLIVEYVYLFTNRNNKNLVWLSAVPVITYAFFHISIYVLMPAFIIIYYLMFFFTKNKRYIAANIAILTGYYLGFQCMLNVSSGYTYGNYKNLYMLKIVNDNNLVAFVTIVTIMAVVINIATLVIYSFIVRKKNVTSDNKKEYGVHLQKRKVVTCINILIRVCIAAGCILMLLVIRKYTTYEFTSIYAYIVSTGVFLVPFILGFLFIKPSYITRKKELFLLAILSLYELFAYSVIFIPYIGFYYYYARYIVIHIPVIIMLGMSILDYIFSMGILKKQCVTNVFAIACILLICIGYKPYDACIAKQKDQTTISWETMEEVMDKFQPQDAIVMSQEWSLSLKLPIKLLVGADVYPVMPYNDKQQMDSLRLTHNNVYLMTEKKEAIEMATYQSELTLIYATGNEVKYGEVREEDVDKRGKYIPFSTIVDKENRSMYLYK